MTPDRDYFLIHEARYKRILREIGGIREIGGQKLKILDVGCYPYHLGAALEKMGHEVWGISSPHEPIKNKKVAILNIETDPFPYKDNTFDLVLFSEVIEHLICSPLPALTEMYRVAKKGGHMLITTPNRNGSINLGKKLVGYTPSYPTDINPYHRHNREFTLRELKTLVKTAGWTVTRATHFISYHPFRRRNRMDNPLLWTGKFANFLAMSAIPHFRDTLLVIGEK
ncbi:MAG: class I SAM-dependent methyltransferase [Candidatus Gottesmanbacteria bacterium]|nr:class I SAM-dependent methyltransferase [Candidatus Gottesmanbacteria bacterium]